MSVYWYYLDPKTKSIVDKTEKQESSVRHQLWWSEGRKRLCQVLQAVEITDPDQIHAQQIQQSQEYSAQRSPLRCR